MLIMPNTVVVSRIIQLDPEKMQCAITENLVEITPIGKFNTIFEPNSLRTWYSQHIAINVNRLVTNSHGCSWLHNKIWYGLFDCNERNIIIMKDL